ncbi:MAG TPA: peptidylprolyl isomerase [Vicinamibacterales bacterium]|nr:peptidylprolyl isomerase [Vicinamibacterales bacterium]
MRAFTGLFILVATGAAVGTFISADQAAPTDALRSPAGLTETAPATFTAQFDTSAGPFVITVNRDWAPHGADRFYNLVKHGFYNEARFFRAVAGFMVQFGLHGNPVISTLWRNARIPADKVTQSNRRGYVTFAMGASPDTRTTQVFINFRNNTNLDALGFAPFGEVTTGMDVVDKIHTGYGEGPPRGKGPAQARIQAEGNTYLLKEFPKLDYVKTATIGQ